MKPTLIKPFSMIFVPDGKSGRAPLKIIAASFSIEENREVCRVLV
jgi:hypothetical protein